MRKNNLRVSNYLGVLATVAAMAVSGTADAAQTPYTTPYLITFSDGRLVIQLVGSGTNYQALTSGSIAPCSNQTMDSLKAWQSLAEAALLSGKRIQIIYGVCGGQNFINTVTLAD
jgi:hypothetical protein